MTSNLCRNVRQCENQRKRKLSTVSVSTDQTDDERIYQNFNFSKNPKLNFQPKYKTELCKNFSETGFCPYRKKCKFAHGHHQLNNTKKQQGRFYRTKKCISFWNQGRCPYGQRCQFMHIKVEQSTIQYLDSWRILMEMQTNQSGFAGSKLLRLLQIQ